MSEVSLRFIGVGEAFDAALGTSCCILSGDGKDILIDCGYGCLGELFEQDFLSIDAVYLTHFHADHSFGLPALLFRMFQDGRKAPLKIISQPGAKKFVEDLFELGYPGMFSLIDFELDFVEVEDNYQLEGINISCALTEHPVPNYAAKFEFSDVSIAFSGDGALTDAAKSLYAEVDYLIHEAFCLKKSVWGHESAENVLQFASASTKLFLVHISRNERTEMIEKLGNRSNINIPVPGQVFCLQSLK